MNCEQRRRVLSARKPRLSHTPAVRQERNIMKTLFTVHAGEYLVGSYIEEHFRDLSVWIPSKDTGIDFLITNKRQTRSALLQVKYSKDWNIANEPMLITKILAAGWWSLDLKKIEASPADFWVFVLPSFLEHQTSFVIIPQKELVRRFTGIFGRKPRVDSYLWVTKRDECWETRGLKKDDTQMLAFGRYQNRDRDFSQYLNNWELIRKKLK